jgi:hypothetical protein
VYSACRAIVRRTTADGYLFVFIRVAVPIIGQRKTNEEFCLTPVARAKKLQNIFLF